jgi:hypothetical protein
MLKNKLNNSGLGKKEMMLVLLIIFAGLAFGLYKILGNNTITQMANFKRLATSFVDEAVRLRDTEALYENEVYLYDTIELNYIEEVPSPFEKSETCDLYESKIEIVDRQRYITFKCSDYYIYNQKTTENYIVYKVSEWTDKKLTGDNVQTATFYNYMVNGIEVLEDYYIEKEFLVKYGMKSGYPTISLENLKSEHELVKKTYYRTLEEVK